VEAGIRRKKSRQFPAGISLPCSGVFPQDPVTFPHLSCRIPRDQVPGIIDLGSAKEGQSTGTLNSLVFHTNSTVDFGFAGIFDTVSDVSMAMSGMG
jgi:hypothetical protein